MLSKLIPQLNDCKANTISPEKVRILFFIGRLSGGGKERRLIELLTYLKGKGNFELMVVVTKDQVHYPDFFNLNITYKVIERKSSRNDLSIFYNANYHFRHHHQE